MGERSKINFDVEISVISNYGRHEGGERGLDVKL